MNKQDDCAQQAKFCMILITIASKDTNIQWIYSLIATRLRENKLFIEMFDTK